MSEALAILEKHRLHLVSQTVVLKENLEEKRDRYLSAQEHLINIGSELIALNIEIMKIKGVLS